MDQQDQQGGHLGADQASDRGAQEEQSAGHDGPADGEVGEVRLREGLLLQEETEEGSGGEERAREDQERDSSSMLT